MVQTRNLVYRYLNYISTLDRLFKQGVTTVSSHNLAALCDITSSQLRKDLMKFPTEGKQKVGYDVATLLDVLKKEIQREEKEPVIIVGVGSFGSALLKYKGFEDFGFHITAGFDIDMQPRKDINLPIMVMEDLPDYILKQKINVAILTVPGSVAQSTARFIVESGINKILNLTPVVLSLPDNVVVNNVNLVYELEYLLFDHH